MQFLITKVWLLFVKKDCQAEENHVHLGDFLKAILL